MCDWLGSIAPRSGVRASPPLPIKSTAYSDLIGLRFLVCHAPVRWNSDFESIASTARGFAFSIALPWLARSLQCPQDKCKSTANC